MKSLFILSFLFLTSTVATASELTCKAIDFFGEGEDLIVFVTTSGNKGFITFNTNENPSVASEKVEVTRSDIRRFDGEDEDFSIELKRNEDDSIQFMALDKTGKNRVSSEPVMVECK